MWLDIERARIKFKHINNGARLLRERVERLWKA